LRLDLQDWIVRRHIRHPCFVELKDRLSGLAEAPLGLSVLQRIQIELSAALAPMTPGN
jgi:hypothetical protein